MAHPNLADPDYEPTDEELRELMKRAFADVVSKRTIAEDAQRVRIARLRAEALRTFTSGEIDR